MNRNLTFLVLLFLSGCAEYYKNSDDPDAATLTFDNKGQYIASFTIFKNADNCTDFLLLNNGRNGILYPGADYPVRVQPNQDISFQATVTHAIWYCSIYMTFRPDSKKSYIEHINSDENKCYVHLNEITPEGEKSVPSARIRKRIEPAFFGKVHCE